MEAGIDKSTETRSRNDGITVKVIKFLFWHLTIYNMPNANVAH